jgi:hypothetical protein
MGGLCNLLPSLGNRVLIDRLIDLHRSCHTREGIGHALQAEEQATGS